MNVARKTSHLVKNVEPFPAKQQTILPTERINSIKSECVFIIKFPYNTRSDWLKERAFSENRARADDGKLAFKFLLWNFDKFDPNIKHPL